ncbi:MAG: thioesterase family protein [Acidimicrobiia bacterium]|nr:thioesterase family protein [Acidimicrobiia bacterium]
MSATTSAKNGAQSIPLGLFTREADTYVPSEFTRGPWRADAQHGGPPSALLAHLCEPFVEEGEFLAQLEIELVRPVPLTALNFAVDRRRISGRVARVDSSIISNGVVVAKASGLVLRTSDLASPEWVGKNERAPQPPPEDSAVDPPRWASGDVTTYHRNAVEHRFTSGDFRTPGPAVDWVRLRLPVVANHSPSGLERLAAGADFGSGISAVYRADSPVGLINANLVISMHRAMVGEWVSLDSTTFVGAQGTGLGVTTLGDTAGTLGIATQSLLGYSLHR